MSEPPEKPSSPGWKPVLGDDDSEASAATSSVPSPRIPKLAPEPAASETFPATGAIPRVNSLSNGALSGPRFDPPGSDQDESDASTGDLVKDLGSAAVHGAVTHKGAFASIPATGPIKTFAPVPPPPPPLPPPPSAPVAVATAVGVGAPVKPAPRPPSGPVARPTSLEKLAPSTEVVQGAEKTQMGTTRDGHLPFFRRLSVLIVAGMLAAVGIGAGLYVLFFIPEPVVLAPQVELIPRDTPDAAPVVFDDPSSFLAGMPAATLTFSLTDYVEGPLQDRAKWPERHVESWNLTYASGTETMTVAAFQHYREDDAIAAFEALAPAAPPTEEELAEVADTEPNDHVDPDAEIVEIELVERFPVMVGNVQVGESVKTAIPAAAAVEATDTTDAVEAVPELAQIMWRNGTAVFTMIASPDMIDDLFIEYGV